MDIDKSGVGANFNSKSKPYDVTAALAIAGDRLYAAFRTGDDKLLQNTGEVPTAPFKTGGALDLMLGVNPAADPKRTAPAEGDLRLWSRASKAKRWPSLYRAVVPGTKDPVPFSSPWRTITLDRVEDVSGQVQLAGGATATTNSRSRWPPSASSPNPANPSEATSASSAATASRPTPESTGATKPPASPPTSPPKLC